MATAKFNENEYYSGVTVSKSFHVLKLTTAIFLFGEDIVDGQDAIIKAYVPSEIIDVLTLSINSKTYTVRPVNGEAAFTVPGLRLGNYSYTVYFNGNDKYQSSSAGSSIEVLEKAKKDVSLIVNADVVQNSVVISVELPRDVTGAVELNVNSLTFTKTPVNGKTSLK